MCSRWHCITNTKTKQKETIQSKFYTYTSGSTDKFSTIILAHLFCSLFVGKSSTEHHSASGLPPQSDEKIYTNLTGFILSAIPSQK